MKPSKREIKKSIKRQKQTEQRKRKMENENEKRKMFTNRNNIKKETKIKK